MSLLCSGVVLGLELESTDAAINTSNFPKKSFSAARCSSRLPIKKGKNPWLRIVKTKTRSGAVNPQPAGFVDSYYIVPANREKSFAIINQEDSIYNTPTGLEKIDCKNGLIYFRKVIGEPIATNYYRVFDLYTGAEYRSTEGAVTMSPDGKFLLSLSAVDRDQKCGRSNACEINMKLYGCSGKKSRNSDCKLKKETDYLLSAKGDRKATFIPLPVRWNFLKAKNQLKVVIGGSKQSPARIKCDVLPKLKCSTEAPSYYEMAEKN